MPDAHKRVEGTGGAEGRTRVSQPHDAPMVFLLGPHGSGKSALGRRVCAELGLCFADLVDEGSTDAALEELARGTEAPTR